MLPTTWCIRSRIALACGFLIEVHIALTARSLSNGWKFFLNSDPLSYNTFCGRGYRDSQTWSNSLDILAEVLSVSGTSAISNQFEAGSMNVIACKVTLRSFTDPLVDLTLTLFA